MKKHKNPLASLGLAFGLALGVSFSATAGEFDGVTLKVATWGWLMESQHGKNNCSKV